MGGKPKSKNTSKLKSSKSKDKDKKEKSKDKKSSKDDKKKSEKSKDKSKGKDKSKKSEMPKVKEEKDLPDIISNEEKEKMEKANLIQNLSVKNQPQISNFQNNINIPLYQEKCEGCYQGDGVVFCNECGKIFCKTCDDQLHVIPSFRNHERIPLDAFSETKMQCYHHNQPLRLFCETCHEPICNKCQKMGPHNTPLHNISSLFQVYKKFLTIGKNYINGPLKEKTSKIEELMFQIDNTLNDSKTKAKELLRQISAEYESVLEKINKLDGNKKAELSFNSSEFQKDMLNIQRILEILNKKNMSYYSNENGGNKLPMEEDENDRIIDFLLQYKTLINEIDQLISKPINKIMTKEDEEKLLIWPKELNDSKEKLIKYEKYKRLIKVKDDIIWKLLTTPYEERCPELFEIEKKSNEEVSKWTQLIEKTKLELSKYNLVCAYCGINLENGMNSICPINTPQNQFDTNKNYTNDIPPEQAHGTDKHFFAEPNEDYLKKIQDPELEDKKKDTPINTSGNLKDSKKNKSSKSINDLMRPSISSDWVNKSARHIEKENINLFQVLSEIDIRGTGYLNIRELIRGMEKIKIILTEEDKNSLKKYLMMSGINENKIDIKNFAQNFGKTSMYDNLYRNSNSKYSNSSRNFSNSKRNDINMNNNENYPQNSSNGFKGYNNSNNFGDTIPKNLTYPQMNSINNNEQGYQTRYN